MRSRTRRFLFFLSVTVFTCCLVFFLLNATFPFTPKPSWSVVISDRNHQPVQAFLSKDDKWRMKTSTDDVNPLLIRTLIQKEDRWFYHHPGINPVAILRASFQNLTQHKRVSGASTITMQVVRLLEPRPRTVFSKIIEVFRALQLELNYSKKEILEFYLSLAPYGSNIEGVRAASLIWFGKTPDVISPAQAVALTIIPNRPSSLRPDRKSDFVKQERNKWLKRLAKEGALPADELESALLEPAIFNRRQLPAEAPHLARRLSSVSGAFDITSTIDLNLQKKVTRLVADHSNHLRGYGINNAAVIVISNKTHEVLAYAGSQDFNDAAHAGQVDGITAVRSPGSALKPLIYAMSFDKGLITPQTMIEDVPLNIAGYSPENFNEQYNGLVKAEDALAFSLNIPAVKLLDELSVGAFADKLSMCGFATIAKQKPGLGLSAALGGCGVTLEELTTMYSMFADGGLYKPLVYIKSGNKKRVDSVRVVSESASFLLTDILTRPSRPDLPQLFDNSMHIPKVAWKTGTSYGRRDAWSIGFNPAYTIGVWVGNFDGTGVPELTGADMATPLLFKIFNTLDYNNAGKWFQPPATLDIRYVCTASGLIPGKYCTSQSMDYYLPGISTMEICHHLKEVKISADKRMSYCTSCAPANGYINAVYPDLSAEMIHYNHEHHVAFDTPPPHNAECTRVFSDKAPVILGLTNGQAYLLEKADAHQLELKCAGTADASEFFWYVNDKYYGKTKSGTSLFFTPAAGQLKISCSDDKGRNSDIRIEVKYY